MKKCNECKHFETMYWQGPCENCMFNDNKPMWEPEEKGVCANE